MLGGQPLLFCQHNYGADRSLSTACATDQNESNFNQGITLFRMGCGFLHRSRRAGDKLEDGPQVNVQSSSARPDISPTPSAARASFLGGFFEWVRSHIPRMGNKTDKSCHISEAPAPRPASQDPIVHSSPTLHRSSASSIVGPASIAEIKPAILQQGPEFVADGIRVHVEPPPDQPLSNAVISNSDQIEEISIGDPAVFSEEDLRAIQSGLLKLSVVSCEGPQVLIQKFHGCPPRVSTRDGGKSHLRTALPVYSAHHCRPDAANPTTCVYVEVNTLWGWSQKGSTSIAFSAQDDIGSIESGPFTSGCSIGLGLLVQYKKADALDSDPFDDLKIFHTRGGKVVEVVRLDRDMLGFDGRHDLFVDVQTVDKTWFEVVFDKDGWRYTPMIDELLQWPSGMESGSNLSL